MLHSGRGYQFIIKIYFQALIFFIACMTALIEPKVSVQDLIKVWDDKAIAQRLLHLKTSITIIFFPFGWSKMSDYYF